MRQELKPGAVIEAATPAEVAGIVAGLRPPQFTRVRAAQNIQLDATGAGQDEVYKVPTGYEFLVRRATFNISTASDPSTGSVALNVAGKYVAYMRSGGFIEYAIPVAPTALAQVPGVQTWSSEEGPYLRNGEVFEIKAVGLTASAVLYIAIQGMLVRPATGADH